MYFVFALKTRHMSVYLGNGKIAQKNVKKKLFSCDYDMVKGRRNVNFEDIDTKPSTGKTFEF